MVSIMTGDGTLVSQREICAELDISRQRFQQLAARADFPEPVAAPGGRRIWRREDIATWDAARKERNGR